MREGRARPLWIISGRWRTPGSTGASGTSCWTSLPLPSAPSSAAPTPGSTSNCSARASWNGSRPSWNCPTASRPTTPSATSSPGWTRSSFQQCFMAWTQAVSDLIPGEVVAIDGKTVRRSHDRNVGKRAIHLVSAWASANTLTLGQVKTAEKSNEITAIPQLLPMLELKGCIVTIDAMGCQQEIAQGILDRGAGYVLALKENQGQLYEDVRDRFEGAEEFGFGGVPHDYATTLNKDHGRIERRECWTISDPSCPGVPEHRAGLARPALGGQGGGPPGDAGRDHGAAPVLHQQPGCPGGATAEGGAHSLEHRELLALEPGRDFRGRPLPDPQGHAPQNMATLRQVSHNLLKNETSLKVGIQGKRLQAGLEGGLPAKSPTQLKTRLPCTQCGDSSSPPSTSGMSSVAWPSRIPPT